MLASLNVGSCTARSLTGTQSCQPSLLLYPPPLGPRGRPLFPPQKGGAAGGQGTGWRLLEGLLGKHLTSWPRGRKKGRKQSSVSCSAVCPQQSVGPGDSCALPQARGASRGGREGIRKSEDGKCQGLLAPCSSSPAPEQVQAEGTEDENPVCLLLPGRGVPGGTFQFSLI